MMRILIVLCFAILFAAILYPLFRQEAPPEPGAPPDAGDDGQSNVINPNDLREQGEVKSLLVGLTILFVAMSFLLSVTMGAAAVIVIGSMFWLKVRQGQLLGQAVKIGPQQLPEVYDVALTAARRIGQALPDLFVMQNPTINAFAMGAMGRKTIVLHSATVEAMQPEELCYVIGHELTHIKCGHTQWMVLTSLSDTLRLPLVSTIVAYLLRGWSRKAEYTADRGGLLACQDLSVSFSAMAKLLIGKELYQQLNIDTLMAQKNDVDTDIVARLSENLSDHPYVMNRARSLQQFSASDYYKDLCEVR
ncbi:MAG: M48 family metallopeptidase [Thiohalomonadales bacterium]